MWARKQQQGFTIVELLIVIVVIAILAAISVVAYNGIQSRARDTQREQDVKTLVKALELYYVDNGRYPQGSCAANCKINASWSTTSDGSWVNLQAALVPKYVSSIPSDPQASTSTSPAIQGGYNYDYISVASTTACGGITNYQSFRISYKLENSPQKDVIIGECPPNLDQPTNYAASSDYYVKK